MNKSAIIIICFSERMTQQHGDYESPDISHFKLYYGHTLKGKYGIPIFKEK